MAKKDASKQYKVMRTEKITQGEVVYDLVAGDTVSDLPDDVAEMLSSEASGVLVEVEEEADADA